LIQNSKLKINQKKHEKIYIGFNNNYFFAFGFKRSRRFNQAGEDSFS